MSSWHNHVRGPVQIGTVVEKNYTSSKEYWGKVDQQKAKEKNLKKIARRDTKKAADVVTVVRQGRMSPMALLHGPIGVSGRPCHTVYNTRSPHQLMWQSLWLELARDGQQLKPCDNQSLALAYGVTYGTVGKIQLLYCWHEMMWSLETYIMADENLAFSIILGLDFLSKASTIINMGDQIYQVKGPRGYIFHPFMPYPLGVSG